MLAFGRPKNRTKFYYDADYRLDHSNLNGTLNLQMHYDDTGNITARSDVAGGATWTYDTTHTHAVTQSGSGGNSYTYDANGNAMSRNGLGITWTSYNHPILINNTGTGESIQFAYTHTHERWSAVLNSSVGVETTYFIGGSLEKVITAGAAADYRHTIYAGGTQVAIVSRTTGGVNTVHYVREDHQGSVATILNSDGTTYVKESFTAFGARRSACTWSGPPTNGQLSKMNAVTRHGYTWQTALGAMGLNDMNGRIQDAVTGRFLSADPTITDRTLPQDYNRYSYVRNNPLTFTDPTGFTVASGKRRDGSVIVGPALSRVLDKSPALASSLFGGASEAIGAPSFGSVDGMTANGDNANLGSLDLNNSSVPTGTITVIAGTGGTPNSSPISPSLAKAFIDELAKTFPGDSSSSLDTLNSLAAAEAADAENLQYSLKNAPTFTQVSSGLVLGGLIAGPAVATLGVTTYVFWSGSEAAPGIAQSAAQGWAAANGGTTLSMAAGATPAEIAAASGNFAAQASGHVVVFQTASGVSTTGTWALTEFPTLMANPNVTGITYHILDDAGATICEILCPK